MIRHELGANVLLLGPWSFKHRSHTQFLQTAEANDLQVIPSFDLRWYWEGGKWGEAATREALKEDFHDFLQYSASVSNEKLSTPDTILMWNLMGLPSLKAILPSSCVAGAIADVSNLRNCVGANGELRDALDTVKSLQELFT